MTVERELWRALRKARLITPSTPTNDNNTIATLVNGNSERKDCGGGGSGGGSEETIEPSAAAEENRQGKEGYEDDTVNWEGCDYSKCGRTDKGVSAFGQVIGIRVRSNRPLPSLTTTSTQQSPHEGKKDNEAGRRPGHDESAQDVNIQSTGDGPESVSEEEASSVSANSALPGQIHTNTNSDSEDLNDEQYDIPKFDPIKDELPYVQILNRILPDDIRVIAWCPSPPEGFSARFSCRERRYRYFFTQPVFLPLSAPAYHSSLTSAPASDGDGAGDVGNGAEGGGNLWPRGEGWLDIPAMREAARRFIGLHDFRNFCKVDPTKQLTNFERRIFHADIIQLDRNQGMFGYEEVFSHAKSSLSSPPPPSSSQEQVGGENVDYHHPPKVYAFVVHGSAFLWHQVRHMMAILFLIGQGLEAPNLVSELLDTAKHPCKPLYNMADETPLVLWDCIFPDTPSGAAATTATTDHSDGVTPDRGADKDEEQRDALQWVYLGDEGGLSRSGGSGGGGGGGSSSSSSLLTGRERYDDNRLWERLWHMWRGRKMDEILVGSLFEKLAASDRDHSRPLHPHHRLQEEDRPSRPVAVAGSRKSRSQVIFDGGDMPRLAGKYVPVLAQRRREPVEEINRRFVARKARPGDGGGRDLGVETREMDEE